MDEQIKILAFGILAEKMQTNVLFFSMPVDTDTLMKDLKKAYPSVDKLKFSIAINKKIISENTPLHREDEVALLPPFSGG